MSTNELPALGEALQRHRVAAGLTQQELAERVGLSARGISDFERGKRAPHPATVRRLAEALGLAQAERKTLQLAARRATDNIVLAENAARHGLPRGMVTFVFTDVEASTRLWQQYRDTMGPAMARHDELIEGLVAQHCGTLVRPRGEGDSRFAVFARASDAVTAACAIQLALSQEPWVLPEPVRVRMAIHTGEAELRQGDYYGPAVNHCARLRAAAHGGQVVVSAVTADVVREALGAGLTLQDLGEHQLKDLERPERIWQLVHLQLPTDFPPLLSMSPSRDNLPLQLTSFIGRGREVAELSRLLQAERLITLVGPGGVGKTRLALEVARSFSAAFPAGVWLVDLAPLSTPDLVIPAIARSLGLRAQPGGSLTDMLVIAIGDKSQLLVLDNFEHVLPAAIAVAELLRACARLKVIATSRSPLHIEGEREVPVEPLIRPRQPWPPPEQLLRYDAVRLFVERAQAVKPDFEVTRDSGMAIAEICARLDGLPLAIEVAAAHSKVLTPVALFARLEHRLTLLVGGPRDRPPRHQTLRATLDWSYNLLAPELRQVFRRLGVFTGSCTLEAAAAVCNLRDAFGAVGSLVDHSLLQQQSRPDGIPRFAMLETMREYALEQLVKEGEADAARRAHADYFLSLCEQASPRLIAGGDRASLLQQLEPDEDNLLAALRWCMDAGEVERGLRLGGAGSRYWFIQGSLNDCREWRQMLVRLAERGGDQAVRALALNGAGVLAYGDRDYATAEALHSEGLAIGRQLHDAQLIASSLHYLGRVALRRSEDERALCLLGEAQAINSALGDRPRQSVGLNIIGGLLAKQGDYAAAYARHAEAAAVCRELGDKTGIAEALSRQGFAALALGEVAAAQALSEEALTLAREDGNRGSIAWCCLHLALLRLTQGEHAAAQAACLESVRLRDNTDEAQARVALALELLGSIAAEAGQPARTVRMFGAAAAVQATRGTRYLLIERRLQEHWLATAADALGEAAASAALAEGRGLAPERALAYSLADAQQPDALASKALGQRAWVAPD